MSLNNTIKYDNKKIKCNHNYQLNKFKILKKSYFFCFKCNRVVLLHNNKSYNIYKIDINDEDEEEEKANENNEFDPILTVRSMVKRQAEQIKYINDKLFLNFSNNDTDDNKENKESNKNYGYIAEKINEIKKDNINKEKEKKKKIKNIERVNSEILNINDVFSRKKMNKFPKLLFDEDIYENYCSQRNKILVYIHKLCTKLKYNDNSFYITLYLADTYLSKIFLEGISEKELFIVILGFFLISSKYIEDDIYEPKFERFFNIEKNIEALTIDEIRKSEIQCLALINYNLYIYSVYDWINILFNNGIIFEDEIKDINGLDKIFNYTQKLLTLITSKFYFCRYSSIQLAFSIIQLSREKYANNNLQLSEKLYNLLLLLYGIEFSDYEECYNIIKMDLKKNNDMDEDEEEKEESSNVNSKLNINLETSNNTNINIRDINSHTNNSKSLNNERLKINNYDFEKISRKNNNRISVDNNKRKRYLKTDHDLNGNKDNKNLNSRKYKNKKNNYDNLQNSSIEIFELYHANKKLTPSLISNTNNSSLNNTSIKSYNFNTQTQQNTLISNYSKKKTNLFLNKKNPRSNTLHIKYPRYLIKNSNPIINNINFINNISITNDEINLYSFNDKKLQRNINNNNADSNLVFGFKMKNNKNNKNNNEIRNNTNHILRKALFDVDNIIPIQLNYEYNVNNINNDKIKNENNNINKLKNIIVQREKMKNNINAKLKLNNKEKFRTHLLLDYNTNQNLNSIIINKNSNIPIIGNKETKSLNKYTLNENDNSNINKKMKKLKTNSIEVKILNTNINLNNCLNKYIKPKKFTLNFKDIVNKKIIDEHTNKFLKNNKNNNNNNTYNNNIKYSKRFKSLNSNILNKDSLKHLEKKYVIINSQNNQNTNENENKKSINNKDNPKSIYIYPNELGRNNINNLNYKNIVSLGAKLPKLRINRQSLITN